MSAFPAVIDVATLDGTNGFVLPGLAAGDYAGVSVSSAGDVNGDGYEDFIIGARGSDAGASNGGSAYVVFGKAGGFPASFDLSTLDGTNGFTFRGSTALAGAGMSVAAAGDINHDGYDDLIIGSPSFGSSAGVSYVVFGHANGWSATLDSAALNNVNGFRIFGAVTNGLSGYSVASAGDVNGDSFDDLFIAAPYAGLATAGAGFVVFGKSGGFTDISLAALDGSNGFKLSSPQRTGQSVASAGDINGDGFDDLIIGAKLGASYLGGTYVVFGKASGFAANLDLSTLNGADGFRVTDDNQFYNSGYSVASAGDINHDGFDDLIIGAPSQGGEPGASYVVFGHAGGLGAGGFDANLNLASLDGLAGFRIAGQGLRSGHSVASAGDVNGDGFDDMIIGATGGTYGYCSAYVVFGKPGGFVNINVGALNGNTGFKIEGVTKTGLGWSVDAAGDINKDGFDDLIVGAPYGNGSTGSAYIIYGHASAEAVVTYQGATGDDTASGGAYDDTLFGAAGADTLGGLGGNDTLDGGAGADVLAGGTGDDSYFVDNAGDTTVEQFGEGNDTVHARVNWTLGANIEALVFDSSADLNGTGNALDNTLTGGSGANSLFGGEGNDTLNGGGGVDALYGGEGNDTLDGGGNSDTLNGGTGDDVYYDYYGSVAVVELAGEGYDTINAYALNYTLPANVEALILIAFGNTNGTGNALDNTIIGGSGMNRLTGGDGNDILDGGGGGDMLIGGLGDDTYYVDRSQDRATELGGEGYDTIHAIVTYTLPVNVEALILDGSANLNATGNTLDNTLTGNGGANALSGGAGKDILYGGAGIDSLNGGSEGDWLDGGTGADAMSGGTGDDSYVVDDAGDALTEAGGEGDDVVHTSVSWTLGANFERLILDGVANLNGAGNGQANIMMGNDGANVLDGAGGEDVIKGGAGNDSLLGGDGADMLYGGDGTDSLDGQNDNDTLNGGAGADSLFGGSGADSLDGGADDDTLDGGIGNDQLFGGTGADSLGGNDGNDVMDGGTGADAMTGGLGDDTYYVDDAGDTTVELAGQGTDLIRASLSWIMGGNIENMLLDGSGNIDGTGNDLINAITGNAGNNTLDGGAGDDVLKGGNGADILIGGAGSDILVGGAGADTFTVLQASVRQSHLGGILEVDTVNDLIAAQGDRLDLSAIDADSNAAGDQAFTLVGNFSHHAGEMTLSFSAGITLLTLDVDGDGSADYRMKISGDVHLDSGGWIL
jgi:Ca2+-binding RTX toxin-like protein